MPLYNWGVGSASSHENTHVFINGIQAGFQKIFDQMLTNMGVPLGGPHTKLPNPTEAQFRKADRDGNGKIGFANGELHQLANILKVNI